MTLKLCGIGTAVPERAVDQKDAVKKAMAVCPPEPEQQRLVTALYRRSGVRSRHSVVLTQPTDGDTASQSFYPPARDEHDRGPTTATRMQRYEADAAGLACRAASAALHQAGVPPDAVTHLVSVSCSGFYAPGFDIELITRLPLPPGTSRTHVGFMGCHGAMNALRVAKAFAEADRRACVLVCALELCSLHHQYGWEDPDTIVANALFADGAAAVVCRQAETSPGDAPWNLVDQASIVIDQTRDLMSWRIGDHGFAMTLSPRVPDVIRRHLRPWLAAWLRQHGLAVEDIGSWAVHPGGPRILQACAESLPLAPPQLAVSRDVLAAFGNMSSPTVLFILERMQAQQASRPCVMLGFGPGLAIEAALLT